MGEVRIELTLVLRGETAEQYHDVDPSLVVEDFITRHWSDGDECCIEYVDGDRCAARAAVVEAAKKWWSPDTGLDAGIDLAQAVKDLCALEDEMPERCGGEPGKPEALYIPSFPDEYPLCPGCRDCRPCERCGGLGLEYDPRGDVDDTCSKCSGTGADHA